MLQCCHSQDCHKALLPFIRQWLKLPWNAASLERQESITTIPLSGKISSQHYLLSQDAWCCKFLISFTLLNFPHHWVLSLKAWHKQNKIEPDIFHFYLDMPDTIYTQANIYVWHWWNVVQWTQYYGHSLV